MAVDIGRGDAKTVIAKRRSGGIGRRAGLKIRQIPTPKKQPTEDRETTCADGPTGPHAPDMRHPAAEGDATNPEDDPCLRGIIEAWPKLDEPIRAAIVQLCRVKAR